MKTKTKTCLAATLVALAMPALHAAPTAKWILDTSASAADKSMDTAGDWSDGANWTNGFVASGADVIAEFWPRAQNLNTGIRYVKLSAPVTVGAILRDYQNTQWLSTWDDNRRVIVGGDNTITISATTDSNLPSKVTENATLCGLSVFAPVRFAAVKSYCFARLVDFCGPVVNDSGKPFLVDSFIPSTGNMGGVRFRRDLWADSASEAVAFSAPTTITLRAGSAPSLAFVAPRGVNASQSTWKTEAGSNRIVPVGSHDAVTVGSTVTCAGYVADGAFVRCIYPDGSLALSSAALQSSGDGGVSLSFGAFHPVARHRLNLSFYYGQSAAYVALQAMKYAEADDFVLEMPDYPNTAHRIQLQTESGFVPARIVLRNTDKANSRLELFDCDVEFAAPTNGTACGFPKEVRMGSSSAKARVTVGDGLSASFASLANVVGTFVKKGGGSLSAPVTAGDVAGAIIVEGGTLTLSSDGAGLYELSTLAVTNGATLVIPSCGMKCGAFAAEAGAAISGSGTLVVPWNADLTGVTVGDGVSVCRTVPGSNQVDEADYLVDPVVEAGVPGNPALWYDASNVEYFDTVPDGVTAVSGTTVSGLPVVKWRDVRGEEYAFATSSWASATSIRSNVLVTNATGRPLFVLIPPSSSAEVKNRYEFFWNRKVTGIRSIFKVIRPVFGGGPLVGGGILRHSSGDDSGSYSYPLAIPLYNEPLFYGVPESYTNTPVYVNGEARDWREGYPYGGGIISTYGNKREIAWPAMIPKATPLLVEFHAPDASVSGDNFGYNAKNDNGYDLVSEAIIYTNVLSVADRLKVRKYLMEKWLAAELNAEPGEGRGMADLPAAGVFVGEGKAAGASSVSGTGTVVKSGAGTLFVADFTNDCVSVRVAQGEMKVNSSSAPELANLPGDPYVHVDASDEDAFTYSSDRVNTWADVRRGEHVGVSALNAGTSYAPTRVQEEALGGKYVVDTGAHFNRGSSYSTSSGALKFDEVPDAHTVVSVLGTSGGGGVLIGCTDKTKQYKYDQSGGFELNGLARNFTSTADSSLPLVASNKYHWVDSSKRVCTFSVAFDNRPGGARTRLNGADVAGGATGFTGGYDLVSFVGYEAIGASGFGQITYSSTSYIQNGGQKIAETLLYTNVMSRASVKKVEAYLNKKWFGRDTAGFRAARMDELSVDAGATFTVVGGEPATVNALDVAGSVAGAITIADGGELVVRVNDDGSVEPLSISGGVSLAGGGTVRLVGDVARLAVGSHPLAPLNGTIGGAWTVVPAGTRRQVNLAAVDGVLALVVNHVGFRLIIR